MAETDYITNIISELSIWIHVLIFRDELMKYFKVASVWLFCVLTVFFLRHAACFCMSRASIARSRRCVSRLLYQTLYVNIVEVSDIPLSLSVPRFQVTSVWGHRLSARDLLLCPPVWNAHSNFPHQRYSMFLQEDVWCFPYVISSRYQKAVFLMKTSKSHLEGNSMSSFVLYENLIKRM